MFYPVKMQKVRIYALTTVVSALVEKLQKLGVVEITVSESKGLNRGAPLESFNEISTQLVRVRSIKSNLPKREAETSEISNPVQQAAEITFDERLRTIYGEITKLENDLSKVADELKLTRRLDSFPTVDFSRLRTRTTTYLLGSVPRENLSKAQESLAKLNIKHKVLFSLREKEALLIILCETGDAVTAESSLLRLGFVKIDVPENLTTTEKYKFWLEREATNKNNQIAKLKEELNAISDKYYKKINSLEHSLSLAADRAEIASKFSFSKSVAVIEGWAVASKFEKLEQLVGELGEKAFVEKAVASHNDFPPTVLDNPNQVKPYQFLTESYSFPNANEFDPSIIFFFTIPFLYGMIVGDVIYGIISVFLALYFMKKFAKSEILSNISRLWLYSAIPAILFGIIFDEYAGMNHYQLLQHISDWGLINLETMGIYGGIYKGLSRLHNLTTIFQITLFIGMIHLAVGLIVGAVNEWHHSKKHAFGKLAWIGVIIGGFLVISTFLFKGMPTDMGMIGAGILAFSIVVIAVAEGVVGILELPGIAGNVFSYMRIAVVGVVGTILAELINQIFIPTPQQGIVALIFFPLFILLHIVNAFIAMFEAVIQGSRLNIIEFKLKFLKGGGRPFRPFAARYK